MHKLSFVLSLLLLPFMANAALIVVNDGDQFNFDSADTYQFAGALSASNTMVTYGVNVDTGEMFDFVVTAPNEFDLYAVLGTGPNYGGNTIVNPNGDYTVYAGTTYTFPVSWLYFSGYTNWLTVSIGNEAIDIINNVYGGSLPIGPLLEGTTAEYIPDTGGGSGNENGGGDTVGGASPIPEPGTLALMGLGIIALSLGSHERDKRKKMLA